MFQYEYDSVTGLWTHRNAPGITFKSLLTAHPKDIHKPKMRTEEYEPAPKLQVWYGFMTSKVNKYYIK